MKKLDLEFAGWLWAINRGKVREYYADHYGGKAIEFTKEIGGQIVRQFFFDSDQLCNLHTDTWHLTGTSCSGQYILIQQRLSYIRPKKH